MKTKNKKQIIKVKNSIHKKQIKNNTKKKVKNNTKKKVKNNTKKKAKPSLKKKKPTVKKQHKKKPTVKKPVILKIQTENVINNNNNNNNNNSITQEVTKINKSLTNYLKNNQVKEEKRMFKTNKAVLPKLVSKRRSYSPSINNKLVIRSLRTLPKLSIKLCDSLLHININNSCLPYNDKNVQSLLLHNLKASKHLDVARFIPPLQFLSNCWFNTMFVTFFFSDKGRKFFRFFRELMITGKKIDSTLIPEKIAKIFFILNLFIEASYNQASKSNILFNKINSLTDKLNTNYFVYHIYAIINKPTNSINPDLLINNSNKIYDIPNIEDPGNPLTYYETILSYLKYNTLKLFKHSITNIVAIDELLQRKFLITYANVIQDTNVIPDIIILEDFKSGTTFNNSITLTSAQSVSYNYVLDSIIITNKDHFDPEANSHFVSVLTVNGLEYKFDGSSLSKLSRFDWKKMINVDKDWGFEEDPKYEPEYYNFTKGYKIMFYYRS